MPTTVTLIVDPADKTSWLASRWLASVELARPIALDFVLAPSESGRRAARVAVAAADLVGRDGVRAVYEAYGRRRFVVGDEGQEALDNALVDAQLPAFLAFAADDPAWDAQLSTASAPTLHVDGVAVALPDLRDEPTGAVGAERFDALVGR